MRTTKRLGTPQVLGGFSKVQNTAPLKDGYLAILRDNEDLVASRTQKSELPTPDGITALYVRLSNDDKLDSESNSISNQDAICQGYFGSFPN